MKRCSSAVTATILVLAACTHARPAEVRPVSVDTLDLRYTISRRTDDTLGVAMRLELPPSRDTVTTLALPDEWAGRDRLYENVIDLRVTSGNATIESGAGPAQRRVRAAVGTRVALEWTLRGTGAPPTRDSHNHSDIARGWAQLVGHDALVLPAVPRDTPVRATFAFAGLPNGSAIATSFGAG